MFIIYSLLLGLVLVISLPWWLLRMFTAGKYRAGISQRLGRVPAHLRATRAEEGCIWLHAVSVGEVLAVSALVQQLRAKYPGWRIAVSTTTPTGQQLARERFGAENVFYLPLDFATTLRPYFTALQPRLLVLAETEFWPNLLHQARRSGARIAVINARISDRSFPRYRRFRPLLRRVLANVDVFLAQSGLDSERLLAIGADAARVQVSGNVKFDVQPPASVPLVEQLCAAIPQSVPVIICGSTVEGEEELLLQAFRIIAHLKPETIFIVAPRHPERFDAVDRLVTASGMTVTRRSRWAGAALAPGIFLLDTVGELAATYQLATVAFVGGSLVPRGGHNILEPAFYAKPVVVGPYTENFRDLISMFIRNQALTVTSPDLPESGFLELLTKPELARSRGENGRKVVEESSGATERTLDALSVLLWMPDSLRARYSGQKA